MTRDALFPLALANLVVALGVTAVPSTTSAQYTAAVLEFEGRFGNAGRRVVVAALSEHVDLVELAQIEESADQQGVDLDTSGGLAQVAASDGVSMFVRGSVRGRGGQARTTVVVVGPDGDEIAEEQGGSPAGRQGMRTIARATRRALRAAIRELDRTGAGEGPGDVEQEDDAEADADEPAFLSEATELDDEEPPDVDEDEDEDEDEDGDEDDQEGDSEGIEGALPVFEVFAGFGGRYRDTDIKLETAAPPAVSRVYSATFGELYGRVTARPFGADGGMAAGLFGSLEFAWAVGLSSVNQDTQEDIGTSAFRLEGGIGWLLGPFGPVRIGPELGFGLDSFSLDPNPIMPTADYTYVRPGAALLVDVIAPYLQVKVDAGLRLVLGTGELAPFFGNSASSVGLDTGIELVGNLDFGLAYGGRFAFQSFGLSFDGLGNPVTNTAIDGTDQRLVFTLFVGYRI